ncbi:hypothetical protein UC8_37050 [Roseimaritima ulvae]|uniref:Uncharacterized protein n=2 Tax=Roseimaritima ulvae TaxID=980254 RepID=A0A5B9QUP2_9BACT|nr:hypothetical protein UC8_37050 [Roseimaritima ulvae]
MGAGKVKCPKCATVLSIRAPAGPANSPGPARASAPAPAAAAPATDPFGGLPNFGNPPSGGGQGFAMPPTGGPAGFQAPASPPSFGTPSFQAPPRPAPAPAARRKSGGGGKTALKIIGIIGALGMTGLLLCGGIILAIGMAGSRHSGWAAESFRGYTINMPAGKERQRKSQQFPGTTVHELIARRKETGSQYSLVVASLPAPLQQSGGTGALLDQMSIRLSDRRPVNRSGVEGVAGTMVSGAGMVQGAECEAFLHNGNLVIATYAPYSKIKHRVGGTRSARSNERELDKPEEYFESLKL